MAARRRQIFLSAVALSRNSSPSIPENQEAFEQIWAARTDEAYMSDLQANHLVLIVEELGVYELYKNITNEARLSGGGSTMRMER